MVNQKVCKYLSWVYGVDKKIRSSGPLFGITRQASRCRLVTLMTDISTPMKDTYNLAHRLRLLIRNVKSDDRTLNFRSDVTYAPPRKTSNDFRGRSLCDVKCRK